MSSSWLAALIWGLLALASGAEAQSLAALKASHHFDCGTVQNVDDWDIADAHGDLSALEGEICRAVAIAMFGDENGLAIHAYPSEPEAVAALQSGEIQLAAGLSPSAAVAMKFGLAYARPIFYDSQRVLVGKDSGIVRLEDLRDKVVCALDMSLPEQTLRDEMTARKVTYALQSHSEQGEMDAAIAVHRCVGTALESRLAQSRANFHARVADFTFLPERIGLAPVAPAYPAKDPAFGLLVDYTVSALIEAEALAIAKDNVQDARKRQDVRTGQLLGADFATAQAFGLKHDWVVDVIGATGNYGEIFARTVGKPYGLERGLNALWTQGGLMTAAPIK